MFARETVTYESNILFTLRFMIDAKLLGMNWVEIPAGKYTLRQKQEQDSCCQYELDVYYKDIISHPPEGAMSNIAPLRILSFDIECAGRKGTFPEAKIDPVIQIANMVTRQGREHSPRFMHSIDGNLPSQAKLSRSSATSLPSTRVPILLARKCYPIIKKTRCYLSGPSSFKESIPTSSLATILPTSISPTYWTVLAL